MSETDIAIAIVAIGTIAAGIVWASRPPKCPNCGERLINYHHLTRNTWCCLVCGYCARKVQRSDQN